MRIARRFNAGTEVKQCRVPKGRLRTAASAVPSGLILQNDCPWPSAVGLFNEQRPPQVILWVLDSQV
jgi:hypothetical protein